MDAGPKQPAQPSKDHQGPGGAPESALGPQQQHEATSNHLNNNHNGATHNGAVNGISNNQNNNHAGEQPGQQQPEGESDQVDDGILLARVNVPELYISKCLQFPKDQLVWDVKQQCLASLPKVATWYRELKESFNYGLFCPPVNGKAGKFLDEERRLGDYPFNGPVGYLELKYKRRVYKMLNLDEKQLKALHTRTNLRRFLDYVANSQVEKIAKMCGKGLDPNFHCQETGETPLTLATTLKKPSKAIIALVNGGALLDYRTKEGLTAMHRAVERNNLEAVKTLLELGASPNYKDTKGLTPLYYSVIYKTDPMLCESLLHDHATIGAQDLQGWQEVHQACRNNLVQHLDHLLFYGADMNARNASGNTPLHVCAVNNTDASCIRQLLFRGAQKDSLNYANQTPYQVGVIAGNMELAEVIKNYQPDEVVPFKGPPRYNPKRRSVAFCSSNSSFSLSNIGTLTRIPSSTNSSDQQQSQQQQQRSGSVTPSSPLASSCTSPNRPSSPTASVASCATTSTASSVAAESCPLQSRVVGSAESYLAQHQQHEARPSVTSPSSGAAVPMAATGPGAQPSAQALLSPVNSVPRLFASEHQPNGHHHHHHHHHHLQQQQIYQGSSGRLPANGDAGYPVSAMRLDGLSRLQEHRIELQYRLDAHVRSMDMPPPSPSPSSRSLAPFSSASSSLSEGSNQPSGEDSASIVTDKSLGDTASDVISDSSGVGTSQSDTTNSLTIPGTTVVCVESYSSGIAGHLVLNQGEILEVTGATDCGLLEGVLRGQGTGLFPAHCVQEVRLRHTNIPIGAQPVRDSRNSRVIGRRESQNKYFATAPRLKKPFQPFNPRLISEPRTVVLHRSKKGFGFVLRGAKTTNNAILEMTPSPRYPALQYLDDVDEGGVADLAGLKKGDFLIEVNGEDVTTALHEHVVDLIKQSGELVRMTVVSPAFGLPNAQSAAILPTSQPLHRQYATLPRKGSNAVTIGGTLGRSPAPMPPRRDPKTTLSVGRARARSMVAGLEGGGGDKDERDGHPDKATNTDSSLLNQSTSMSNNNASQNNSNQPRTASIRARPTSSRITAAELEELFQRQQGNFSTALDLHYGTARPRYPSATSTKSHPSSPAKSARVYASVAEMKRKGKSNSRVRFFGGLGGGSDLRRDFHSTPDLNVQAMQSHQTGIISKGHRSQEDVNALSNRNGLPPPNHPPPPPPVGQVVKVNVTSNTPDVVAPATVYDNIAHIQQVKELAAATEGNYGVMSSFRPADNAKLYASPEDMKNVGYRSLTLPNHSARAHLRKSHSLRASSVGGTVTFKDMEQQISNGVPPQHQNGDQQQQPCSQNNNQYAQPLKNMRSLSVGGVPRESRKKKNNSTGIIKNSAVTTTIQVNGQTTITSTGTPAPPIPDPDYSLSESDNDEDLTDEAEELEITKELEKAAVRDKLEASKESSGNSNISAGSGNSSSSGSSSLQQSFSVEEIQNVRKQLKTQQTLVEDGDNSSSGVSSDQEVPGVPVDETTRKNETNNIHHHHQQQPTHQTQQATLQVQIPQHQQIQQHHHHVHHLHLHHHQQQQQHHLDTVKEQAQQQIHCPANKRINHHAGSGHLTRHAVSLAQLPPPIEADAEEQAADLFVPPPPEFNADGTAITQGVNGAPEIVFAPPPQFSDNKCQEQQSRVKIIGAIPKTVTIVTTGTKVKPPTGRMHSQ